MGLYQGVPELSFRLPPIWVDRDSEHLTYHHTNYLSMQIKPPSRLTTAVDVHFLNYIYPFAPSQPGAYQRA